MVAVVVGDKFFLDLDDHVLGFDLVDYHFSVLLGDL